ncbi:MULTISPECIES: toprim domain-containing protein [unclassified Colwellia]|uniref:toprim domain-containing protein n=1 Tax=unclassified Colwellia TaxID=196834 RepID=UPI0015F4A607|nr:MULTISPECIES: toprim domain-containing protein [unclassified Colwellia]MBA6354889.1 toprim domain-containing protein [Colwellia sp. BRX8-3]MBA6360241.1 toprim domain-containing protein [Colwellia sp. BRX8-6]MBA6367654.1 toprim domain-containing protein [Colwellia sp. BRX8-5]MBA6374728.1 toprim domain-containing protein [Colwellia sp. BRX8-2]
MNYQDKLTAAINFGLLVKQLICDAELHRVPTQLSPQRRNGWYIAFTESPTIVIGDWQTGITETWKPDGHTQNKQERIEIRKAIEAAKKVRTIKQFEATKNALALYNNAKQITDHNYLTTKGISPPNVIRCHDGLLVIPLIDYSLDKAELINVQTINEHGFKKFTKGGRVTGLCCPIEIPINQPLKRLYIAEGFSTAVSVYQLTGHSVLAAMNANNLAPIAKIARHRWPDVEIIITGDDDYLTERKTGVNTGKDKAINAASIIRAKTAFPPFTFEQKLAGLTDWNDYEQSLNTKVVS